MSLLSALDFRSEVRCLEALSLPLFCFLRQETLLYFTSPSRCINGCLRRTAGGKPEMY